MDEILLMLDKSNLLLDPNFDLNLVINDNRLVDFSNLALNFYDEKNIPYYDSKIHSKKDFEGFVKEKIDNQKFTNFLPYEIMYFLNGDLRFGQSSFRKNGTIPVVMQGYLNRSSNNADLRLIEFYNIYPDNIYDKDGETILLEGNDFFLSSRYKEFYHELNGGINSKILQYPNGDLSFKITKFPRKGFFNLSKDKKNLIFEGLIEFNLNQSDITSDLNNLYHFLNTPNDYLSFFKDQNVKLVIVEQDTTKYNEFDVKRPYKYAEYKTKEEKFIDALQVLNNL